MSKKISVEILAVFKGLIFSLMLALIATVVVYYTPLSEMLLSSLGKAILILSVFYVGISVSRFYGNRGLVRGITMGLVCFILMLIATMVFNFSLISLKSFFSSLSICLVSGALGGILGLGLSNN